jgi:predicted P-loop ATPase
MNEALDVDKIVDLLVSKKSRRRAPRPQPEGWLANCLVDDAQRIMPILANVMVALRGAPELADAFTFDQMARAALLVKMLPVAPNGEMASADPAPRPVRDADASQLQEWLQHAGMPKIGKDVVHQGIDLRAQERAFHPVRDYLDRLKWDGMPRLDAWLSTYLGAAATPYAEAVGRMFLVSMVARIFEPGCKVDHTLILEGRQGAGKSRACRVLAGEWFSDSLPDLHDKDAAQHIRGKWLIELAELAAIGRAEAEALKAFISRSVEKYRPAYGRKEVTEPRQCVFVETTNKSVYLKDETGARRFWPVKVGKIDVEALAIDRDLLFAEAVAAYRRDEKWWPDGNFEHEHIRPQQEARYEADAWEQAIVDYIAPLSRIRIMDVARDALHIETGRIGTAEQRRIIGVLTSKGWTSGRDWQGRYYTAPATQTMTHVTP